MPQATCWASVTTTDAAGAGWPQQPARIWQAAGEVSPCGLFCLGGGGELFREKSRPPCPNPRTASPVSPHMFSQSCADVFQFLRRCFPDCAHIFYCPQLWVIQPTIMGRTTHSYGSYDPQLWAVEYLPAMRKTCARKTENMRGRKDKLLQKLPCGDCNLIK